MSKNESEILLADNPNRYVMFPLQDHDIWSLYKKMFDCMWRAEEIDLSKDMVHWETLNDNERHFIKMILAFFAASDGIVVENLGMRFLSEVQLPEARTAYGFQLMMENVHSEVYSLMIDTYIKDKKEKTFLLNAVENIDCVAEKARWAMKWIESDEGETNMYGGVLRGTPDSGHRCVLLCLRRMACWCYPLPQHSLV